MTGWSLGPFVWLWLTSFKKPALVAQLPPVLPPSWDWQSYASVLGDERFVKVIWNSLIVSFAGTSVSLIIGAMAAFGILGLGRKKQKVILLALLVIFMIPPVAMVTPLFKFMVFFHMMDTLAGLILVYSVFTVPLVVWIMHDVFAAIPPSLPRGTKVFMDLPQASGQRTSTPPTKWRED